MSTGKNKNTPRRRPDSSQEAKEKLFPFTRENYVLMIIGLAVLVIGYLLMIGGKSPDPGEFYPNEVYSFRRITLSPIVIFIGFAIEIYAIMKKPGKNHAQQ